MTALGLLGALMTYHHLSQPEPRVVVFIWLALTVFDMARQVWASSTTWPSSSSK